MVLAIASRDLARAKAAAETFAIPRAYGSYEELLADVDVDAVYIPLPNTLHAQWTSRSANAGKHVLCEKPLATSSLEARGMVEACAENGVLFLEAFMYRFHPRHERVRTLLAEGVIGDVRFVRSSFTDMLEPFGPARTGSHDPISGGALLDLGSYCVSVSRMLFGEEPVWASAQWDYREDLGGEVSAAGILGFSQNRSAVFDCGFRAFGRGFYVVAGTKGQIDVHDAFATGLGEQIIRVSGTTGERTERIPAADHYAMEAAALADAVLGKKTLPIRPDDGVSTIKAIDALRASAKLGGIRAYL